MKKTMVFNKNIWLNQREQRLQMVEDLIQNKTLLNLTKKEVLDILGFEFNDVHSNVWTYYLGKKAFFIFSFKRYLCLHFTNGIVNKTAFK